MKKWKDQSKVAKAGWITGAVVAALVVIGVAANPDGTTKDSDADTTGATTSNVVTTSNAVTKPVLPAILSDADFERLRTSGMDLGDTLGVFGEAVIACGDAVTDRKCVKRAVNAFIPHLDKAVATSRTLVDNVKPGDCHNGLKGYRNAMLTVRATAMDLGDLFEAGMADELTAAAADASDVLRLVPVRYGDALVACVS